jgi:hypothetical protein
MGRLTEDHAKAAAEMGGRNVGYRCHSAHVQRPGIGPIHRVPGTQQPPVEFFSFAAHPPRLGELRRSICRSLGHASRRQQKIRAKCPLIVPLRAPLKVRTRLKSGFSGVDQCGPVIVRFCGHPAVMTCVVAHGGAGFTATCKSSEFCVRSVHCRIRSRLGACRGGIECSVLFRQNRSASRTGRSRGSQRMFAA